MVKNEQICVEIITPAPLTSRVEGEKILGLWETYLPDCLPDKYGNWEPIDLAFDLADRDGILEKWKWPFLATKRRPKMDASVFMRRGPKPLHAFWCLAFRVGEVQPSKLALFLEHATSELDADFGCLTLLTRAEIDEGLKNKSVQALDRKATQFIFSIYSQHLQQCLPDVYWTTVFGPPYVAMFGRDKLLSAPAFRAKALCEDRVLLQLTQDIGDVSHNPAEFANLKQEVKDFLGSDSFYPKCSRQPVFIWERG